MNETCFLFNSFIYIRKNRNEKNIFKNYLIILASYQSLSNRHRIVNKSMSDKKFLLFPFHPLIHSYILCHVCVFVYVFFKKLTSHLGFHHHLKKYYQQDFNYYLTVSILDFWIKNLARGESWGRGGNFPLFLFIFMHIERESVCGVCHACFRALIEIWLHSDNFLLLLWFISNFWG